MTFLAGPYGPDSVGSRNPGYVQATSARTVDLLAALLALAVPSRGLLALSLETVRVKPQIRYGIVSPDVTAERDQQDIFYQRNDHRLTLEN